MKGLEVVANLDQLTREGLSLVECAQELGQIATTQEVLVVSTTFGVLNRSVAELVGLPKQRKILLSAALPLWANKIQDLGFDHPEMIDTFTEYLGAIPDEAILDETACMLSCAINFNAGYIHTGNTCFVEGQDALPSDSDALAIADTQAEGYIKLPILANESILRWLDEHDGMI